MVSRELREDGNDGKDGKETAKGPSLPDLPVLPDIPAWTEAERLAKEKEVLGFFISGHPLERYREEVELFGSRTTATLSEWGEQQVSVAAVVTGVKRQISKKTGKEYARLVLEDFHGTAEAIVFPDCWAKLNQGTVSNITAGSWPSTRCARARTIAEKGRTPQAAQRRSGRAGGVGKVRLSPPPSPDRR